MSSLWPKYKDAKLTTIDHWSKHSTNSLMETSLLDGGGPASQTGVTQGTQPRAQGAKLASKFPGSPRHYSICGTHQNKFNPRRPNITAHITQRIHYQCSGARYHSTPTPPSLDWSWMLNRTGGSGESGGRVNTLSCLSRSLGYSWVVVHSTWISEHKVSL